MDLLNNMDHMRISGNEPSSVILSQTKWFQTLKMFARKCQNQANLANRDGVINPQNFNFSQFNMENVDALKHYESTIELGDICPRGLLGLPAVTLTK